MLCSMRRTLAPLQRVAARSISCTTPALKSIKPSLYKVKPPPPRVVQSVAPLGPIGMGAAAEYQLKGETAEKPQPQIFKEFSLHDRVGIVTGGNGGLGLEMAVAFAEAGARSVYCLDIAKEPSPEWQSASHYVENLDGVTSKLFFVNADVRNQQEMWGKIGKIGKFEERMDFCVAAAGVLKEAKDCLDYPKDKFEDTMEVNSHGAFYTAQAAGQEMRRLGTKGSIILVASMSGSITNKGHKWVDYNTSKSAVLQTARSMACELGKEGIRVNSLSPGHIHTNMTAAYLDTNPELLEKWSDSNPLGRLGRPDEMRGVAVWLASDASSFCTGSDIIVSGGHHSW